MKVEAMGTIEIQRSEPQDPPCRCCGGLPHAFACGVRIDAASMPPWLPRYMIEWGKADTWVSSWVSEHSAEGIEGKRVRLTLELVATPALAGEGTE